MTKQYYLPREDKGRMTWLNNFSAKLNGYATRLDVSPETLSLVDTDAKNLTTLINYAEAIGQYKRQVIAYKNLVAYGLENPDVLGATQIAPSDPPALPAIDNSMLIDIFGRVRKLVQTIKNHKNYTEAIGKDMGIVGADIDESRDRMDLIPELRIELIAGHPNIKWKKSRADAIKLFVSRSPEEPFTFMAIDTIPDYLDNAPLPPAGVSAVWRYEAIYVIDDSEVGKRSEPVKVTVTGS